MLSTRALSPGDFTRLTRSPEVWRRQDAFVQRPGCKAPQRVSDPPLKLTDCGNEPPGIGPRRGEVGCADGWGALVVQIGARFGQTGPSNCASPSRSSEQRERAPTVTVTGAPSGTLPIFKALLAPSATSVCRVPFSDSATTLLRRGRGAYTPANVAPSQVSYPTVSCGRLLSPRSPVCLRPPAPGPPGRDRDDDVHPTSSTGA
jgi:hypothetical protein